MVNYNPIIPSPQRLEPDSDILPNASIAPNICTTAIPGIGIETFVLGEVARICFDVQYG